MKQTLLTSLLALLLVACGTPQSAPTTPSDPIGSVNPTPETIREFTSQKVNWEACDPTIFNGEFAGIYELTVTAFGDRLECATVKTPLDWNRTELDKIDLGMLRVRAANPEERKGAVLINPGGPGGDGLPYAAITALLMSTNPVAAEFQQVLTHYDIVGFSPRGLGGSSQHFCGTNRLAPFTEFYTDRSPENLQAILAGARLTAEACQSNPTTKYIDSEQTAWDMELMRRLFKDDKINYLGYSYGSWLGAFYAKRFPSKAGNFVLDSNSDFSSNSLERTFRIQPQAFQETYEKVVIPYLVRNSTLFNLGDTNEAVQAVYDTLPIEVKAVVTGEIVQTLYSALATDDSGAYLIAAQVMSEVFTASPTPIDPNAFLQQLNDRSYSADPVLDETARTFALERGQILLDNLEKAPEPVLLPPGEAVLTSVLCNDGDWNRDPNVAVEAGNKANEQYPLTGGGITGFACTFWKKATTSMPETPENIPPLLLIQAEFDAATNTRGALDAFASVPNAKMVFVNDEKLHGVFPHNTACVDAAVAKFLFDGTLPNERITRCAANPLPGETQVFPADGITPQNVQGMKTFPVQGEKTLNDYLKEIIQRNAIQPFGNQ
jgi:pimeloyl-ACP methyl ester carboxylesterase